MNTLAALKADMDDYRHGPPESRDTARERSLSSAVPILTFDEAVDAPIRAELVEGLLPELGLAVVYGASGTGKTFVASDVGLHIACGCPWRGCEVQQGTVAYVAAEAQAGFGRRLKAWRMERLGEEAPSPPFYVVPAALDLFDPGADTGPLIASLAALPAPLRLVVVDTLARTIGAGDENAAKDIGVLVGNLDRIGRETGALVMVVHHAGKDEDKGARGSGALRAAADTEIHVKATGQARVATVRKQRDGEDGLTFPFRLVPVQIGEKPNGKPITSCVVEHLDDGGAAARQATPTGQAAFALQQLHNCLAEEGKPATGGRGQPGHLTVVPVMSWRARCYAAGIGGGDSAEARKKAFQRAYAKLLELKAIAAWNDEVWPL